MKGLKQRQGDTQVLSVKLFQSELTAAMVAASHSSFTNTVKTEAALAQTEHES